MPNKACTVSGIVMIALIVGVAHANAGSCAVEIASFRSSLPQDKNGEAAFVARAPQSIAAQLEHQPTRESVERAKKQAQAHLVTVLTRAEELDSQGSQTECWQMLAQAKLLLRP